MKGLSSDGNGDVRKMSEYLLELWMKTGVIQIEDNMKAFAGPFTFFQADTLKI